MFEHLSVQRDCNAITIPDGASVTLNKGSEVVITQALGGNYTVNYQGRLLQVAGEDADALGQHFSAITQLTKNNFVDPEINFTQIFAQLKTCYDPEIPVNIVELGLIYDVNCYQLLDGGYLLRITMTLTSAGCGMGAVMVEQIKRKCLSITNVEDVEVSIVFDPLWSAEMLSDTAKVQLGLL